MAVLTPQPKMQFTSAAGVPLSGGKVYTYVAGTTTPQTTYTDYTGATPNSNPIILDSRGEANIWLGSALYKFRLTDANDVEIWTVDYISAPTSAVSPVLSGNVTIDSDTPTPALKITQTGTGPVLRVQDSADPDATPFIIDNNGNVGVGTASPATTLEVKAGTLRVAGPSTGYIDVSHDSTNGSLVNNTGSLLVYANGANPMVFYTDSVERARITSVGNVGIGVTAPTSLLHLYNASSATLQVTGDGTTSIIPSRASTDATAALVNFRKYRGSQAAPTTVATSDQIGVTSYSAYDGTALCVTAQIVSVVETYTTTDNVSGYLSFLTRPTGVAAAATERMRITANGDLWFNSGYGSAAAAYGCRAWVNFNGTGTVAIRASGNVTSITDNGTGDYTVNMTNAMPDANYSSLVTASDANSIGRYIGSLATSSSQTRIRTQDSGGAGIDQPNIFAAIFR